MIKIFITVRNRLAVTKKCLLAIKKHSKLPHQIYVYDNLTNYLLREHFEFFYQMYEDGLINQITFTDKHSTFNAFSKAVAINMFGKQHLDDPYKMKYKYLMMMDNDIIVTPGWDKVLTEAWNDVQNKKMNDIKVISQLPGGIKNKIPLTFKVGGCDAKIGFLGGGGIMSVRPNFFNDVGFLPINALVGHNKKSDQIYWNLMAKKTKGKPYILGLQHKIGIHVGGIAGSQCNTLTKYNRHKDVLEKIKFEDAEKKIESMSFEKFYDFINTKKFVDSW
jgi:hypothetical protein